MEITQNTQITMKKIPVQISWSGDNYCAGTGCIHGVVFATGKTLERVKKEFVDAFQFHISGCIADGDQVEDYLKAGYYELDFKLDTSAQHERLLKGIRSIRKESVSVE